MLIRRAWPSRCGRSPRIRPAPTTITAKGNLVAVISNGTAILGLGNLGALASKPVMEGKAVLFKRFADVDAIDIEVKTEDAQRFIECVELLEPSFGGINLEDIAAPDCFIIEQTLRERMNIPVFHDDQHGTAIITAAGLINACLLTGRKLADIKVVVNGAGAAAIACTELIKAMGVRGDNVIMCDRKGVIYKGRTDLDQWKSAHAVETDKRTLAEALEGADVFLGLSAAGALKPEMVEDDGQGADHLRHGQSRSRKSGRPTRRPRGPTRSSPPAARTSRTRSTTSSASRSSSAARSTCARRRSTTQMKIAAAEALAELAREPVPEEVAAAYGGRSHSFGRDYIIPAPFDPRLMEVVASAVAEAAVQSGVAQKPIADMEAYRQELRARLNPTVAVMSLAYENARQNPEAGPVRRGRGAQRAAGRDRLQGSRLRHAGAGRPRGGLRPAEGDRASRTPRNMRFSTAATRRWSDARSTTSTPSTSATACCAARSSGWSTRTAIISPRRCSRWAKPTR